MGTLCFNRSQFVSKKIVSTSFLRPVKSKNIAKALTKTIHNSSILTPTFCQVLVGAHNELNNLLPTSSSTNSFAKTICTTSKIKSFNEPLKPLEKNETNICWNCELDFTSESEIDQLNNLLTCPKCNVLRRPPKNIDHFELFGIQRKFKMDLKKLAQKYKSMQRILHPDR